ncbi:hypothetical protein [Acetobacter sp. DsW_063]|uniref:hypothetical protein n=1 Tax=Acetobacter sp. DsW_063 TaxID=1514894 RepID=UPI000A3A2B6A|nr:hypothetical protein [Acetobacter sp. DsW_063]OUJ14595.1 hypothetical protein HK28_12775 [Acetobacter sp. DsW_063]
MKPDLRSVWRVLTAPRPFVPATRRSPPVTPCRPSRAAIVGLAMLMVFGVIGLLASLPLFFVSIFLWDDPPDNAIPILTGIEVLLMALPVLSLLVIVGVVMTFRNYSRKAVMWMAMGVAAWIGFSAVLLFLSPFWSA